MNFNNLVKSPEEEKLENRLIENLREFSRNNYHDTTTGFQRRWVEDIIRIVREHDKAQASLSKLDLYREFGEDE